MLDGARAVRYVRSHAADFGIAADKIGVWGFSAGGNLAGYLATEPFERDRANPDPVERVSAHPDFAIFSYARFSMDASIPRSTGMEGLVGNNPTPAMLDTISPARHVTKETSPSFIYSTTADQTVNSMTPYQTTSSLSVSQLSSVAVTNNGFSATLPALSITTYVQ